MRHEHGNRLNEGYEHQHQNHHRIERQAGLGGVLDLDAANCTGTTGTLILEALKEKHPDEEWDFTILKSGPLGGDQQMGSRIVDGQIDYLFFFTDPMTLQPHDTDVKALTRLAGVENIVFCCNRSTADHIISSPLFMDPDYERIHPDYSSYTKRFQDKPVVTEAVESVNRRKKKRK